MKPTPDNQAHAKFTSPGELRMVRLLPGPIERVWDYLINPEKRARWLSGGMFEAKPGGKIEFIMHHAKLAPGETPPEKFKHIHDPGVTFGGRVLRCEPPRLLVHTFGGDDSEVTFELTAQGNQVLLVLTHRAKGEDLPDLCNFASGWHTHCALLIAELEGSPRPPLWATHTRLLPEYEKLRAAAKA
jgi:uncharacterized protein YndB with AHSA1/START domain